MDITLLLQLGFGITFFAALILLLVLFTPKFFLMRVKAPPDQALAYLAYCLRTRMYHVEEKAGHLKVRMGSSYAANIYAQGTPQQTDILYKASATPSG